MPASATRAAATGSTRLSIGQVLDQLRDEFPDLAHSKLHYLEAEGLITPERTASGYRKYSSADVDRLVFVLRAQRDRYWPLKVIKEHLLEHGTGAADGAVRSIASRPGPSARIQPVRLTRLGLLREARIDEVMLRELEQYGLVENDLEVYGSTELEIARAVRDLADHGLHPRHLVMIRTAAEREAHMVRSVADPRSRRHDAAARGEADDLARDLGEQLIALHTALLRNRLPRR